MMQSFFTFFSRSVFVLISDFLLVALFIGVISIFGMLLVRFKSRLLKLYFLLLLFRGLMQVLDTIDSYLYHLIPELYGSIRLIWDIPRTILPVLVLGISFLTVRSLLGEQKRWVSRIILIACGGLTALNILIYFIYGWNHRAQNAVTMTLALSLCFLSGIVLTYLSKINPRYIRNSVKILVTTNLAFLIALFAVNLMIFFIPQGYLQILESRLSDTNLLIIYAQNIFFAVRHVFMINDSSSHRYDENLKFELKLSPRESEIAAMAAAGKTNQAIGEGLFISEKTVKAHIYNMYRKLGVNNRVELSNKIRLRKDSPIQARIG